VICGSLRLLYDTRSMKTLNVSISIIGIRIFVLSFVKLLGVIQKKEGFCFSFLFSSPKQKQQKSPRFFNQQHTDALQK